ncbi:GtrA family protein [Roseomonas elaeocarpi]|uniref:GtrA family protein n=1 Tax=Roseomonas elaeocarpi TaxID=907779 RepID=A0ABV6JSE0_9PROT
MSGRAALGKSAPGSPAAGGTQGGDGTAQPTAHSPGRPPEGRAAAPVAGGNHLRRLWDQQFIRFLVTGGLAAAVNVASRIGFSQLMPYEWAVLAAYLCGMTTAWALSRRLVFARSGTHWSREYTRFALVNLVAAAQVWLISVGLNNWLFPAIDFRFHPGLVAHMIGVVAPVFTSYLGHKHFSFAPGRTARTPPEH